MNVLDLFSGIGGFSLGLERECEPSPSAKSIPIADVSSWLMGFPLGWTVCER